MFTGSEIIAPEINQEAKLNLQQDEPFIIYARNYMQPCFADYVPNQAEVEGSFNVDAAQSEDEPVQVSIYVPSRRKCPLRNISLTIRSNIQYQCSGQLDIRQLREQGQGHAATTPTLETTS